mmetsp:Transcript_6836/g.21430  ORF Transcript_6836/g.21430 Transcript_6836/m.21430 type:complete len:829 (-) Transcript_6836:23-2509(-)
MPDPAGAAARLGGTLALGHPGATGRLGRGGLLLRRGRGGGGVLRLGGHLRAGLLEGVEIGRLLVALRQLRDALDGGAEVRLVLVTVLLELREAVLGRERALPVLAVLLAAVLAALLELARVGGGDLLLVRLTQRDLLLAARALEEVHRRGVRLLGHLLLAAELKQLRRKCLGELLLRQRGDVERGGEALVLEHALLDDPAAALDGLLRGDLLGDLAQLGLAALLVALLLAALAALEVLGLALHLALLCELLALLLLVDALVAQLRAHRDARALLLDALGERARRNGLRLGRRRGGGEAVVHGGGQALRELGLNADGAVAERRGRVEADARGGVVDGDTGGAVGVGGDVDDDGLHLGREVLGGEEGDERHEVLDAHVREAAGDDAEQRADGDVLDLREQRLEALARGELVEQRGGLLAHGHTLRVVEAREEFARVGVGGLKQAVALQVGRERQARRRRRHREGLGKLVLLLLDLVVRDGDSGLARRGLDAQHGEHGLRGGGGALFSRLLGVEARLHGVAHGGVGAEGVLLGAVADGLEVVHVLHLQLQRHGAAVAAELGHDGDDLEHRALDVVPAAELRGGEQLRVLGAHDGLHVVREVLVREQQRLVVREAAVGRRRDVGEDVGVVLEHLAHPHELARALRGAVRRECLLHGELEEALEGAVHADGLEALHHDGVVEREGRLEGALLGESLERRAGHVADRLADDGARRLARRGGGAAAGGLEHALGLAHVGADDGGELIQRVQLLELDAELAHGVPHALVVAQLNGELGVQLDELVDGRGPLEGGAAAAREEGVQLAEGVLLAARLDAGLGVLDERLRGDLFRGHGS